MGIAAPTGFCNVSHVSLMAGAANKSGCAEAPSRWQRVDRCRISVLAPHTYFTQLIWKGMFAGPVHGQHLEKAGILGMQDLRGNGCRHLPTRSHVMNLRVFDEGCSVLTTSRPYSRPCGMPGNDCRNCHHCSNIY